MTRAVDAGGVRLAFAAPTLHDLSRGKRARCSNPGERIG